MAGVDPLNDLIRAPGHSPAKLHTLSQTSTHTHTHYKALPASNNTLSVLATGAMEEPLIPLQLAEAPTSNHLRERRSMQSTQDSSVSIRTPYGCWCEAIHCLSRQSEWWKEHRVDSVLDEGGDPLTPAIVSSPPLALLSPHKPHINS